MSAPKRSIGRGALEAVTALPLFATAPLYRRWHLRWGATDDEVACAMPGDELVPRASFNATRAISVDAPPEAVWPWVVQMGHGRAGFYSYDLLDNAGYESADRLLPEHQSPQVGDWMPMAKKVNDTTAFRVGAYEANEWLLWVKPDSTWAWKLQPLGDGGTRLIVRLKHRYDWTSPASTLVGLFLMEFGDFAMMRRALIGIKSRAEHLRAPSALGRSQ
jgi:hypothetical protein